MGVQEIEVTVISCDGDDGGCDTSFENKWGDRYFEFPLEDAAIEEAKVDGWEFTDDSWKSAYCPDCAAKRKRAAEGKPELPVEIPGQLDLLAAVTR